MTWPPRMQIYEKRGIEFPTLATYGALQICLDTYPQASHPQTEQCRAHGATAAACPGALQLPEKMREDIKMGPLKLVINRLRIVML
jgi:hypothetical protein